MASDSKVLDTSGKHSVEIGEATIDLQWLPEDGVSLLRSYRGKDNLTDDDVTVIALVLSQAILTRYLHPDGGKHAWETVNDLLSVLDHPRLVEAVRHKVHQLLIHRKKALSAP
jgi:hypothetical protein